MRDFEELKKIRQLQGFDAGSGHWIIHSPADHRRLNIIASWTHDWDHVSISCSNRTPTWKEMEFVKRLFFKASELAIQFHVPPSQHINIHPNCLHMWRPQQLLIPLPPQWMV